MKINEAIHIIENVNANTNCDNCFYKYDGICEYCYVEMAIETLVKRAKEKHASFVSGITFGYRMALQDLGIIKKEGETDAN